MVFLNSSCVILLCEVGTNRHTVDVYNVHETQGGLVVTDQGWQSESLGFEPMLTEPHR